MERNISGVSRRAFLTSLGAVAGGGAVLGAISALGLEGEAVARQAEPFEPPSRSDFTLQGRSNDSSVLVLGAGIAGLCCAYELRKAGYAVTVLEAASRIGGRNWTARSGTVHVDTRGERQECSFGAGRWMNTGPARIAQHHTTLAYCRELDVAVEVFVNANIDAYVERDGVVRRRRSAGADIDGYISELLIKAVRAEVLDAGLTASERDALIDHMRSIGALGRADRGYEQPPGVDAGEVGEPDPLGLVLGLGVGERLAFERGWHQAMPMFHPIGGMDQIVEALAAAIGRENIVKSTAARRATTTASGVAVSTAGGESIRADWGVCCLQPSSAASLMASWLTETRSALLEPGGVATGKIGLDYNDRFWETGDGILGGTTTTESDVRVIWYPSTGFLSPGGVLIGAYPFGPDGARFDRLTHPEREELAVRRGVAIHGDRYAEELASSFSVGWASVPNIQAAWTSWPRYGAGYRRLLDGEGRWFFAGDWLSRTPGWQHGAFESARHAVTTLHRRALAE